MESKQPFQKFMDGEIELGDRAESFLVKDIPGYKGMGLTSTLESVIVNTGWQPAAMDISFHIRGDRDPILQLKGRGSIFVNGRLVDHDKEVVDALRDFLRAQGYKL